MFGNFFYFIVVLLIYSTYPPAEEPNFAPLETLFFFVLISTLFAVIVKTAFGRLEQRMRRFSGRNLDNEFEQLRIRLSILAVAVFATDVYGLNLPDYVTRIPLFSAFPTAAAVVFLLLFIGHMALIWTWAYPCHRRLSETDQGRTEYVLSNISFSVPVLLPWLVLSGVADLILALPFELPKRLLSTPQGEVAYFLTFLVLVAVFGPLMIQKFWRCRPLDKGPVRDRIEQVCQRAGVRYADILFWPLFGGRMITAAVMGLVGRFRYILVTSGLLQYLAPSEIDAVVAHEIGHVKRRHLPFYLFFFVGYILLAYSSFDLIVFLLIYSDPVYRFVQLTGLNSATVSSALFSIVIITLFLLYFRFIFGYFMRNFERQADLYAYELFQTAEPLISTFKKIAWFSGQSPDKPNWHHFGIGERIDYLQRCEADRSWIHRHHRKVRNSILVYLVGIVMVGAVGVHLNYGESGRRLSRHFMETVVLRELSRSPQNAELYRVLGDIYYGSQRAAEAAEAYKKAVELAPDNAVALNNLAWLYATSERKNLSDPEKALSLAEKAASIDPSPHVLDTLAESYYVNGRYERAVEAGRRALAGAWTNKGYYEEQLRKFEKAAGAG